MKKIIFIDRDGVINRYPGDTRYVTKWNEFKFLPKVKSAISRLTEAGFNIFIISNQACVSKGLLKKSKLDLITKNMLAQINEAGGRIRKVLYCIHTNEDDCSCRKPKTGLIDRAFRSLGNRRRSRNSGNTFFIGDSIRDVETANRANLKSILVLSGKEKSKNKKNWCITPDYVFSDLSQAVDFILF